MNVPKLTHCTDWRLDTNQPLLGGMLGPNETIGDIKSYTFPEREQLASQSRPWGELTAIPSEIVLAWRYDAVQRRAVPHEEVIAAEEQRRLSQEALESTEAWRDWDDLQPTIQEFTNAPVPPYYPDEGMFKQVNIRLQEILRERTPSIETQRQLIDAGFRASLTSEEGRALHFAIGLSPIPLESDLSYNDKHNWFIFEKPLPLDVHQLTKLAPACDASQGFIGVQVGSAEKLEIWGFLHTGSSDARQRRGMANSATFRYIPVVRITGPGDLTVEIGVERIAEMRGGKTTGGGSPVFFEDSPVLRFLRYYRIEEVLQPLLRRVRDQRHGGALFLVPKIVSERINDVCDVKYLFNNPVSLLLSSLRSWQSMRQVPDRMELFASRDLMRQFFHAALVDAVEMVAGMTGVDGALLLAVHPNVMRPSAELIPPEPTLGVIGFGAVVRDIETAPPVFRAVDVGGKTVEKFNLQDLGTRHRSAACFCSRCPGALAFIASQDGVLSCMTARKDIPGHDLAVVLWRPVEVDRFSTIPAIY